MDELSEHAASTSTSLPATRNDILVGRIASWVNRDDDDTYRTAGRGEVVAALDGQFLLVRQIRYPGDPEPPYMMVLSMIEPGTQFYDTLAEEQSWRSWVMNDAQPVISLVQSPSCSPEVLAET